jgi:23S rRNA pseudouridine1911/1915/1917 synthase
LDEQWNSGDLEREIPARHSGQRLDQILAELFPERTKAALQKLVRRGKVHVDGERVLRSNIRPRRRAKVRLFLEETPATRVAESLDVVFEDEHIIEVNKPAWMLTHSNEKEQGRSLADIAVGQFGRLPMLMGEHRPGVVHRLDRETSGLLILARSAEAMENLQQAFRERQVRKQYIALVHGALQEPSQSLRWGLDAVPNHRDRQVALPPGEGKRAETDVEQLEDLGPCALIRCRPHTGRRHQIRVHLHAAGAPIVGDKIYGAKHAPRLPDGAPPLRAHALHAAGLEFAHPVNGKTIRFESPLREEFASLVEWLRAQA